MRVTQSPGLKSCEKVSSSSIVTLTRVLRRLLLLQIVMVPPLGMVTGFPGGAWVIPLSVLVIVTLGAVTGGMPSLWAEANISVKSRSSNDSVSGPEGIRPL